MRFLPRFASRFAFAHVTPALPARSCAALFYGLWVRDDVMPIAAWMATTNIWRLMIFAHLAATALPRYRACVQTMMDKASTLSRYWEQEDIHLDHVGRAISELVVHARVTATDRFELVEEVQHDLAQRQSPVVSITWRPWWLGVDLHTALLVWPASSRAHVVCGGYVVSVTMGSRIS